MRQLVRREARTLGGIVMIAAVAACSAPQAGRTAMPVALSDLGARRDVSLNPLHNFGRGNDGYAPQAGLLYYNQRFYGTTQYGGTGGNGTIFEISDVGKERILYNFRKVPDGAEPVASLIELGGQLYGTTQSGGKYRMGTVFSVGTSGKENWVYSFGSGGDGAMPVANLTAVKGVLYGTTLKGGSYGGGTIFSINPSKSTTDKILHSFGYGNDGSAPASGLIAVGSLLYGTTSSGGGPPSESFGTVFSVSHGGSERVIVAFNCTDGAVPVAALVKMGGTFYGATSVGGTSGCSSGGDGTIFALSSGGAEHVVHAFGGGTTDGYDPLDTLTAEHGRLYGTAYNGGANGGGIVFDITPAGLETILHDFGEGTDGNHPIGGVIHVGNAYYGTTSGGGVYGGGIVYGLQI
jgi:uncharacterized repeat protein (TIGR03803 family)